MHNSEVNVIASNRLSKVRKQLCHSYHFKSSTEVSTDIPFTYCAQLEQMCPTSSHYRDFQADTVKCVQLAHIIEISKLIDSYFILMNACPLFAFNCTVLVPGIYGRKEGRYQSCLLQLAYTVTRVWPIVI